MGKALVVDDEKVFRETYTEILSELGYTVFQAGEVDGAIEKFEQNDFDLILTDYQMPGSNGDALVNHIRVNHPFIPVLVVSGTSPDIIEKAFANKKALKIIYKPFRIDDLIHEIEKVKKPRNH